MTFTVFFGQNARRSDFLNAGISENSLILFHSHLRPWPGIKSHLGRRVPFTFWREAVLLCSTQWLSSQGRQLSDSWPPRQREFFIPPPVESFANRFLPFPLTDQRVEYTFNSAFHVPGFGGFLIRCLLFAVRCSGLMDAASFLITLRFRIKPTFHPALPLLCARVCGVSRIFSFLTENHLQMLRGA